MKSRGEIEKVMKKRIEEHHFANAIGIETLSYHTGYALLCLPIREEFLNPLGVVHGGVLYSLADTASGTAIATYGKICPTISGDLHFMRPAKVEMKALYGIARVIKHGRSISTLEVSILPPKKKADGTYENPSGKENLSDPAQVLCQGIFSFYTAE